MFILIDNYDSFTWNLWHFLSDLGADVDIVRNDNCSAADIIAKQPQGVIISPGPGIPKDAGMTIELISLCHNAGVPLLGVCLGHQALACAFGGSVKRVDPPVHGKLSRVVAPTAKTWRPIYLRSARKISGYPLSFAVVDESNCPMI